MNYIEAMRPLGGGKVRTRRYLLPPGAVTDAQIAALMTDGYTEVYDHILTLYKPAVDPEQAVQAEIDSVKGTVTALLSGEKSDKLVELLDYILDWTQRDYVIGDVRKYNGQPKVCCQAHDSTGNPTWNPTVASLWSPYHAQSAQYALPWIQPTGAQDMYKAGEYMVFEGVTYKCLADTVYTPVEYAQAWEVA